MIKDRDAVGITELVLRDAHQSLFATRLRLDDMLPIAEKIDQVGFWSVETWGGATFDSCIRYLGEDPWVPHQGTQESHSQYPSSNVIPGPEYPRLSTLCRRCGGKVL